MQTIKYKNIIFTAPHGTSSIVHVQSSMFVGPPGLEPGTY